MSGNVPIWRRSGSLAWPAILLGLFFAVPFLLTVLVSLSAGPQAAALSNRLTLDAYGRALSPDYLRIVLYSIGLAIVIGALSVGIAFPFTCLLARMRRRAQAAWLVFLFSTLSLSEVLIVFAWQIMLSRRVGLSNILVKLGLLSRPENYAPSLGGVVVCLVYLVLPFSILMLYPGISRIDAEMTEAARTLGASPRRTLLTVVIPNLLRPIGGSFAVAAIMSVGSYVTPLVLGRPVHWTASVQIATAALTDGDFHTAAAMSLVLLAATLLLLFAGSAGLRRLEGPR